MELTRGENIHIGSEVVVPSQDLAAAVAAIWCPTEAASGLPWFVFIYLLYLIHYFQALAD